MATYVLIHGAGSDSWYWHLVVPRLRERGHDVVAVDLPCDDDTAGLEQYTDVVIDAIGDRSDLVLVAQSMGGFTAPLVADRRPARLIVLWRRWCRCRRASGRLVGQPGEQAVREQACSTAAIRHVRPGRVLPPRPAGPRRWPATRRAAVPVRRPFVKPFRLPVGVSAAGMPCSRHSLGRKHSDSGAASRTGRGSMDGRAAAGSGRGVRRPPASPRDLAACGRSGPAG